ncbi:MULTISPECIES: methyl-accepting chemotaxis protein [Citrobacter]|jgi:methyl-accepting chemotaxis protein-3 (ribose and galactose sensor receptor)|uniref:methyl-accepting chemotaxis protein n=1 Tax=Citrobacter TaxID=544 RepID=UPI000DFFE153|nr:MULTISPECIES: methyl-accepting chemotaxis protein [Citrobacter]STE16841.1 methyl-accepting chemotaxis protein III (ribose an galactose chemoreceptor protein) [Escherichia coli]MBA7730250.1 Tar ligand binding domain-containing protein [Citrobacter freundii]MCS3464487.1 methyl-accepting chemotaxis protein-3 (ribose and galactose sensor receptor) [Citrobacter sp. JUb117]QLO42625.1 Tar ligand binding domain-containing protein [Citrobacter freundii]QLR72989.1 Tar ligand binding domain-containing
MDNTTSMQAQHKLGFLHQIRLVPLFSSILGGILLLFALSSGLASYFLMQADRDQRDVTDEIQVRMGLSNSSNHLRTSRINMIHAGAASRIAEMDDMKANIAEAEKRIKQSQEGFNAYLSRAVKTPADEALDAELSASFKAYIDGLQPMLKYAKNGMFEAIINHENEQARPLDTAYNKALLKAIEIRTARANQLSEQAHHRTQIGMVFMLGAFGLALALTLMTFMVLRRTVIHPLLRAAQRIEQISAGDLTMQDEPTGRSEIGRLSRHLQAMQHSLVKTVGTVRQGAEEIYRGTSEISMGNTDLSSRTEEQAAAIEQTAASMEELTATVKQNADNAHHASKLAEDASGKASRGGQMVSGVVHTMGNISTSSKKISEITAVINSIAFQTNILALNAAVEAARAGEQGRGFAVVASEVRTLASRSAQAAKEIEGLISESVRLIDQGSGEVVAAGNTMTDIVDAVKRVTDIMLEIAAASDEQSRGIVQVSQAISEMDKVTQQNASLVEEASAAAASLEEQAARLTQAVGTFRLQGGSVKKRAPLAATPVYSSPQTSPSHGENWETF